MCPIFPHTRRMFPWPGRPGARSLAGVLAEENPPQSFGAGLVGPQLRPRPSKASPGWDSGPLAEHVSLWHPVWHGQMAPWDKLGPGLHGTPDRDSSQPRVGVTGGPEVHARAPGWVARPREVGGCFLAWGSCRSSNMGSPARRIWGLLGSGGLTGGGTQDVPKVPHYLY